MRSKIVVVIVLPFLSCRIDETKMRKDADSFLAFGAGPLAERAKGHGHTRHTRPPSHE
jgi:hypothetical protein